MQKKLPFELRKPKVLEKKKAETNPSFGCRPEQRKPGQIINYGIVNINKPKGPTSHQASDFVQKILGISKAGHSGTLDPAVTGVLPMALGRATKIVEFLLPAGKEYVCVMHLHREVPTKDIEKVFKKFTGKIKQKVPRKAAVKRTLRQREIYYFEILEIEGKDVLFRIGCQAGTYVRKLCHDIGRELKTGAHMAQLHRTQAGPFTDKDYVTLQDLEDAVWYWKNKNNDKFLRYCIKPVEFAVQHLPKIWVLDNAADTICTGATAKVPGISKLDSDIKAGMQVAVMTLKDELIAAGTAQMDSETIMQAEKGIAVKTDKVFMEKGTYKN